MTVVRADTRSAVDLSPAMNAPLAPLQKAREGENEDY